MTLCFASLVCIIVSKNIHYLLKYSHVCASFYFLKQPKQTSRENCLYTKVCYLCAYTPLFFVSCTFFAFLHAYEYILICTYNPSFFSTTSGKDETPTKYTTNRNYHCTFFIPILYHTTSYIRKSRSHVTEHNKQSEVLTDKKLTMFKLLGGHIFGSSPPY